MKYYLPSTNDNTDRTADIQAMLDQRGACLLGDGLYVVSGVNMPKDSALMGVGNATKVLQHEDVEEGCAVKPDSYCTVEDVRVMGSLETIERPTGHGLMFLGDATPQKFGGQPRSSIITGCLITAFTGGGITCRDTRYATICSLTMFSNSSFSNKPASIHVEGNPHVKFVNCYTRDEECLEVGL